VKERLFLSTIVKVVDECTFAEHFRCEVKRDPVYLDEAGKGRVYIQIVKWRRDVDTGEMGDGPGAKIYLSPHMTETEIVHAVFGAYKGWNEHESRETFEYKGKRVFGPHIDINAMIEVADRLDVR
jgi:hypothetical protein